VNYKDKEMYIQLPIPDKKCSQCGAINQYEHVIKDMGFAGKKTYIQCSVCGHRKLMSILTTYPEGDMVRGIYPIYELKEPPKVEEF